LNCRKYVLVDLWAPQANYKDLANVDQGKQDANYMHTRYILGAFAHKTEFCRNYTTSCVPNYPDGYFDFIYVDALHDFKGVYRDLTQWWPKLRAGGIFAGHDYVGTLGQPRLGWTPPRRDRRPTHLAHAPILPCDPRPPRPEPVSEQSEGPGRTNQDWTLNYDGATPRLWLIRTRRTRAHRSWSR
jgi:hypothetical protein